MNKVVQIEINEMRIHIISFKNGRLQITQDALNKNTREFHTSSIIIALAKKNIDYAF